MGSKHYNGLDAKSQKITSVATPTASDDAATKGYVDGRALRAALTADTALVGNATENIIKQATIPANTLVAGSVIRVVMFASATGSVTAFTPKLRLGAAGTTSDLQVGNLSSPATLTPILNHAVRIEFIFTLRTAGAAGVATAVCNMTALSGNSAVVGGQQINLPTVTVATLDTTVQNIVTASLQQATAGATVTQCVIEVLP